MTPTELLEEVKGQFVVLFHNDAAALSRLLKQALGKYQEKAGILLRAQVDAAVTAPVALPPHYLSLAIAVDNNAAFVPAYDDANGIVLQGDDNTAYPVTLHYYADLRNWPDTEDLPNNCIPLVMEYLKALIDIPNAERTRSANAQIGIQAEVPSAQELREVVANIEMAMEDSKAIPIPVAVF